MPAKGGRFIAGALCPACGELDRLLIEQRPEPGGDEDPAPNLQRRCVACGYLDSLATATSQPPTTRLDGALSDRAQNEAQPVRILKPDEPEC